MIPLVIAPEPGSFNEKVRHPGQNALACLAGAPLPHRRDGRPITAWKKVGKHRVRKSLDDFPYWRECLDDLHDAYRGICAYYCFRVEKAALPQVDHFVAKANAAPALAYEWSNFRLACGYANTCKNDSPAVLDPAQIHPGEFVLDLATLRVAPGDSVKGARRVQVDDTIQRLKLNEGRALEVRQHAMAHFRTGRVGLGFLEMDHPFLAAELRRQGVADATQLPAVPASVRTAVEPEL